MADDEQAGAPKGKRGTGAGNKAERPERRALNAYNEYMSALADAWASTDPTDQAQRAYSDYLARVGEEWTPERMAERYADASRLYVQTMEAFLDPAQDQLEVYRTFLASLAERSGPQETEKSVRDAFASYLDEYEAALAPQELERRGAEAWQAYLAKLKEVWSQVDPSADPEAVSVLGQSAQAAAAAAASLREAVRRRQEARESVAAARPT